VVAPVLLDGAPGVVAGRGYRIGIGVGLVGQVAAVDRDDGDSGGAQRAQAVLAVGQLGIALVPPQVVGQELVRPVPVVGLELVQDARAGVEVVLVFFLGCGDGHDGGDDGRPVAPVVGAGGEVARAQAGEEFRVGDLDGLGAVVAGRGGVGRGQGLGAGVVGAAEQVVGPGEFADGDGAHRADAVHVHGSVECVVEAAGVQVALAGVRGGPVLQVLDLLLGEHGFGGACEGVEHTVPPGVGLVVAAPFLVRCDQHGHRCFGEQHGAAQAVDGRRGQSAVGPGRVGQQCGQQVLGEVLDGLHPVEAFVVAHVGFGEPGRVDLEVVADH